MRLESMDRPPTSNDDRASRVDSSPSVDDVLGVLAHPMRREVIRFCTEQQVVQTDLDAIVEYLNHETGWADEAIDRDQLKLRLHHLHLPKLADGGLLEFDPRSGQVRYRSHDMVESWLARLQTE